MHFSQEANRVIQQNQQSHGQASLLKLLKDMTSSQSSAQMDSPTSKLSTPMYHQMRPQTPLFNQLQSGSSSFRKFTPRATRGPASFSPQMNGQLAQLSQPQNRQNLEENLESLVRMLVSRVANTQDGQLLRCEEEMSTESRVHQQNFQKPQTLISNMPDEDVDESISITLKPNQVKTILNMITRKTRDSATQTDAEYVKPEFKRSLSFRKSDTTASCSEALTQPCRLQLIESKIVSDSEEDDNLSSQSKAQITTVEQSQIDESEINTYHIYEHSQPVTSSPSQPERQSRITEREDPFLKITSQPPRALNASIFSNENLVTIESAPEDFSRTPKRSSVCTDLTDSMSLAGQKRSRAGRKLRQKTATQHGELQKEFDRNPFFSKKRSEEIAQRLGLTYAQVYKWLWDHRDEKREKEEWAEMAFRDNMPLFAVYKVKRSRFESMDQ